MALVIFRPNRKIAGIIILIELLAIALDQNRLQPWEYQFLMMIFCYWASKKDEVFQFCCQLILVGIYFFSGVWKLNGEFVNKVWVNLTLRQWLHLQHIPSYLLYAGYLPGLAEAGAALLLLHKKTRTVGMLILAAMHIFILLLMISLQINTVIWPWNICMPVLLILLFYRQDVSLHFTRHQAISWMIIILFWIMPVFQPLGYWNYFLSFKLYTADARYLYICTSNIEARRSFRPFMQKAVNSVTCDSVISVYKWAMKEMNSVASPEEYNYRSIARQWRMKYPGDRNTFYIFHKGKWKELKCKDPTTSNL